MTTLALAEVRFRQFLALTKPRVVSLIVFCAVIGMFLAVPGVPPAGPVVLRHARHRAGRRRRRGDQLPGRAEDRRADAAHAAPAAARRRDHVGLDARVRGDSSAEPVCSLLYRFVNPLTMWLTLATFVGYAIVYTVLLKPATPQNIVIGGASGAMPPVLGWAAVTNDVAPEALLLFLIIFVWTPPHFWSLALYRAQDYAKAGLPMLPVTHGRRYTQLMIVLYTVVLVAVTLLPFADAHERAGSTSAPRCCSAASSSLYAVQLYRDYSDELARATFKYSIFYLAALFSALLLDHYSDVVLMRVLARFAVVVVAALALAACGPDAPKFRASDVTGTAFGRDFTLTDHTGKPRTLADYRGKAVVLFFGYTQCPDVCPTTLAELAEAMKRLGPMPTACRCCSSPSIRSATRPRCLRNTCRRSIRVSSDSTAMPMRRRAPRRNSRSSTRSSRAGRLPATRWTIRRGRSSSIRRGGCGCTSATGRDPTCSCTTSRNCSVRTGKAADRASARRHRDPRAAARGERRRGAA